MLENGSFGGLFLHSPPPPLDPLVQWVMIQIMNRFKNHMFYLESRGDLNQFCKKPLESWVDLNQILKKPLESWVDLNQVLKKPLESELSRFNFSQSLTWIDSTKSWVVYKSATEICHQPTYCTARYATRPETGCMKNLTHVLVLH